MSRRRKPGTGGNTESNYRAFEKETARVNEIPTPTTRTVDLAMRLAPSRRTVKRLLLSVVGQFGSFLPSLVVKQPWSIPAEPRTEETVKNLCRPHPEN